MPNTIEVEYPDDDFRCDTYWINEADYDPDVHTRADAEPTDELVEVVGARAANALAAAGLDTLEAAATYDGDLTALDGVGDATAATLDADTDSD